MRPEACIIDTNVVVSGLIGADPTSPPARILDAMLDRTLLYRAVSPCARHRRVSVGIVHRKCLIMLCQSDLRTVKAKRNSL